MGPTWPPGNSSEGLAPGLGRQAGGLTVTELGSVSRLGVTPPPCPVQGGRDAFPGPPLPRGHPPAFLPFRRFFWAVLAE